MLMSTAHLEGLHMLLLGVKPMNATHWLKCSAGDS